MKKQVSLSSGFPHGLIHERRDPVIVVTGDEYDRYHVGFMIDGFTDGDLTMKPLRSSAVAFVRTKDLESQ